jgi:hypothetical protein
MKTLFLFGVLMPTVLVASAALADDKAACLNAASQGQRLRDAHKLVEAREQLRLCAASQCPAVVQSDCANWLAELDKELPSVVLTAKNGTGADLVDVKVSMDGKPLVSRLDGQAVPMNAGAHTFHFEEADGTSLDQQVMIKEGEKSQAVAVVLGPVPSVTQPPAGAPGSTEPAESNGRSHPGKTVGWVLGSVGIVGLGVGAVAGFIALGDKNNHCVGNVCDAGTVSGIKSAALASDIGWIAGGVLVAGGAALVLFTPSGSHEATAGVRVAPIVTAGGGGIVAAGSW